MYTYFLCRQKLKFQQMQTGQKTALPSNDS
jgi:hypothetical protein